MPGCFDNFEGSQEELDTLVAEIQKMADSGQLFSQCQSLDEDYLEENPEIEQAVFDSMNTPRVLQ